MIKLKWCSMKSLNLAIVLAIVSQTALADRYEAATNAAFRAAYIQTGAQDFENKFRQYFENQGKLYVYKLGVDQPLAVGLYFARVYSEQSITLKLLPGKDLTLNPQAISVRLQFGF